MRRPGHFTPTPSPDDLLERFPDARAMILFPVAVSTGQEQEPAFSNRS